MIPCSELRIGNYVLVDQKMQRITMVDNATFSTTDSLPAAERETTKRQPLERLQPVPLNDAVLQRCSFVYHDYFKFWQRVAGQGEYRSEMDIDPDYNIIDFMRKPVVKKVASLHQLQNIYFVLKGKELDVREEA